MRVGATLFWVVTLLNAICSPLNALMLLNALAFQVQREIWIATLFLVGLVTAISLRVLQRETIAWLVLGAVSLLNVGSLDRIG